MTAARAGIPQVLVPHMFDQPYWAQRMHAPGVAPLRFLSASPEVLAAAIEQACTDPALTRAAVALAEKIRASDGVGAAVRFQSSDMGPGGAEGSRRVAYADGLSRGADRCRSG